MPRQSTIKRLPPAIRDKIGALLDQGRTLDEIVEHLAGLDVEVSRSALGRYKQHIDKVSERIRRSREIAEAIVRNQGEAPESKAARLNIELLHGVMLDMISQLPSADDAEADEEQPTLVSLTPRGAMELAKAMDHLSRASKSDADLIAKLRDEARKEEQERLSQSVDAVGDDAALEKLSAKDILERVKAVYRGEA